MNETECRRSEQFPLLSLAGGAFDQLGRIPFAEKNLEPLQLQPPLQQVDLGGFARAIQPFNRDQPPGKVKFRKCLHSAKNNPP